MNCPYCEQEIKKVFLFVYKEYTFYHKTPPEFAKEVFYVHNNYYRKDANKQVCEADLGPYNSRWINELGL